MNIIKLAKEKGIFVSGLFDLEELLFYNYNIFIIIKYIKSNNDIQNGFYFSKTYYYNGMLILTSSQGKDLFFGFDTYEECLEAALQWTLLAIK